MEDSKEDCLIVVHQIIQHLTNFSAYTLDNYSTEAQESYNELLEEILKMVQNAK